MQESTHVLEELWLIIVCGPEEERIDCASAALRSMALRWTRHFALAALSLMRVQEGAAEELELPEEANAIVLAQSRSETAKTEAAKRVDGMWVREKYGDCRCVVSTCHAEDFFSYLSRCFKQCGRIVAARKTDTHGAAANLTIFNVRLLLVSQIEQHGYLFAAVRARKKMLGFHAVILPHSFQNAFLSKSYAFSIEGKSIPSGCMSLMRQPRIRIRMDVHAIDTQSPMDQPSNCWSGSGREPRSAEGSVCMV